MSKSDDIHKAILARASQPAAARPAAAVGARPYVAEAGHRLAEGLREENQRLKAERASALMVLRLDPKRVRATKFINRDERSFLESDAKFISLKESLRAYGQDTPIRVRPVTDDAAADYEVVFGHRRHRACLALDAESEGGFHVLALLDSTVSEARDLVLKMFRENEEREEQCAYDKGRSFRQWLSEGIFADQAELARAIGVSPATVTKYLQIADLPEAVLAAFEDTREISVRWSLDLSRAVKLNPGRVGETAARLANTTPRPPASAVARALIASAEAARDDHRSPSREQVSKIDGRVVLRQKRRDGLLTLKFYQLDKKAQREIIEEIWELAERRIRERLKGSSS
ncbi:MAG: ParB/RepB/Spo0J family partition protein [Steroidobacteraceae bacterium]